MHGSGQSERAAQEKELGWGFQVGDAENIAT